MSRDCSEQIRRRDNARPVHRLWPASAAKSVVGFRENICRVIVRFVTIGAVTAIL